MKASEVFYANRAHIRRIVESNHALNPRIFGSVARGTDTEDSDLDILIDSTSQTTLFDLAAIQHELIERLGVEVDIVTTNSLPEQVRARVLAEAIPV